MGRVAVDFGAGQGANAAPISTVISVKRATPASTKSDSNPSGAIQNRRLAASLVRYSPRKGMRLTPPCHPPLLHLRATRSSISAVS